MRKLKVVSALNWRQEKGFKRMSNRNFYYSGEERLGGAGWVCPIYVLGRRGEGQSQHSAKGSGTQVCLLKVFL